MDMSNNKQSSIDWLVEKMLTQDWYTYKSLEIIEQAKAMHKDEHSNTWDKSVDDYKKRGGNDMRHWVDFDDYYNETFGGNNAKKQNS